MGGKGAKFENGKYKEQLWKQDTDYGTICGIKVLKRVHGDSVSLPYRSVKPSTAYISLTKKTKMFKQLRVFDANRNPIYDIDYSPHDGKVSLHIHYFVDGERAGDPEMLHHGDAMYEKYRPILEKFGL